MTVGSVVIAYAVLLGLHLAAPRTTARRAARKPQHMLCLLANLGGVAAILIGTTAGAQDVSRRGLPRPRRHRPVPEDAVPGALRRRPRRVPPDAHDRLRPRRRRLVRVRGRRVAPSAPRRRPLRDRGRISGLRHARSRRRPRHDHPAAHRDGCPRRLGRVPRAAADRHLDPRRRPQASTSPRRCTSPPTSARAARSPCPRGRP